MSDQIEWMAKKLYSNVPKEDRHNFLHALKYHRDYVEQVTAQDVEGLSVSYTMEVKGIVCMSADQDDPNVFVTYARKIVDYLCDELLKEEIAAI